VFNDIQSMKHQTNILWSDHCPIELNMK
jgi:hypothetical protein